VDDEGPGIPIEKRELMLNEPCSRILSPSSSGGRQPSRPGDHLIESHLQILQQAGAAMLAASSSMPILTPVLAPENLTTFAHFSFFADVGG
jgi:hypothetical protein